AGAASAGVKVSISKIVALMLSAAVAGLGGAIYASFQQQVSPQVMAVVMLISILTMVYVGGVGSVYGAAGGAILMSLMGELLRGLGPYRLLAYALILILVLFIMPNGLIVPLWRRLGTRAALAPEHTQ